MPRTARRKSMTEVYHVMLRGIGQQIIFHDDEDYQKLIQVLYEYKETCKYELYAYCLVGNHIHLLIKVNNEGEKLERIFRRIGAKYVYWYNLKYGRIGHLFQDRYKSEPVEDDKYLPVLYCRCTYKIEETLSRSFVMF